MKQSFRPYQDKTLSDFMVLNESHDAAVKTVGGYLADLEEARTHGQGLIFLGPNGVGKTMLASIVVNAAKLRGYRTEAIELATYVSLFKEQFLLTRLMQVDVEEYGERCARAYEHIQYIKGAVKRGADWVLFDDVGREFPSESGWSQGEFFDTLRFRWNRQLPTILTTNLPRSDLEQRYTEGMTSLLMESSKIITLEGGDYRCRGAI